MTDCGDGSALACLVEVTEGLSEVADPVPAMDRFLKFSGGPERSDLSLSLPRRRAKKPCGFCVLGDFWDCCVFSRFISENELGVGLDGRPRRLVLDAKAELKADAPC